MISSSYFQSLHYKPYSLSLHLSYQCTHQTRISWNTLKPLFTSWKPYNNKTSGQSYEGVIGLLSYFLRSLSLLVPLYSKPDGIKCKHRSVCSTIISMSVVVKKKWKMQAEIETFGPTYFVNNSVVTVLVDLQTFVALCSSTSMSSPPRPRSLHLGDISIWFYYTNNL